MRIQLSYYRLGFFGIVTAAGWLLNLLALQLPFLMPLLAGNIAALVLTQRLGVLWGLLSLPVILLDVPDQTFWLSSLLQVLVVAFITRGGRLFWQRLFGYALLLAACVWVWPDLFQALPHYAELVYLLLLLHFAVNLYGCAMLLDITATEQTLRQQSLQHQLSSHIAAYALIPVSFLVAIALNAAIVHDLSKQNAKLNTWQQQYVAMITQKLSHLQGILALSSAQLNQPSSPYLLKNLVTSTPEFISALLTNETGQVLDYFKAYIDQDIRGASVAHRAYFQQPRLTGQPYISEVFQGEKLGKDWLFAISSPYRNAEQFAGVIEASVLLTRLTEQFKTLPLPKGYHIVLMDTAKRNLWSSQAFAVGQPIDLPWLEATEQRRYFHHSWFNPLSAVTLTMDSRYLLGQQGIAGTHWQLLIYQDNLPHLLRYHGYLSVALLLLLGLMVIMRASAAHFVNNYTKTLSTLVEDLEQFKLEQPTNSTLPQLAPAREFEQLALSINQMQRRIRFTHQQLQKVLTEKTLLSTELERRVVERTAELSAERDRATRLAEAKNRFLANMSHELRTPLAIIQGFTRQLQKPLELQPYQGELRSIEANCEFLLHIVNDILDSAKMEENKLKIELQQIDFHKFLIEICQTIQPSISQKGLQFEFIHPAELPAYLMTDSLRLKQILLNLLSNALKFTREGFIRFEVEYLAIEEQQPQLFLTITDTGVGISPAQQQYIFDAFEQADVSTTRQYGGTGLGLYICKKLAELLGIQFTLQSEAGIGSRFSLQWSLTVPVPLVTFTEFNQAKPALPDPAVHYQATVLLVDDVAELRQLFSQMLTEHSLQVICAENGEVALQQLQQHQVHLILLDMHMPVKDGPTTLKELRALGYQQPVLALTADVLQEKHQEMLQAGCQQVLTKPLTETALLQAIAPYLQEYRCSEAVTPTTSEFDEYDELQLSYLTSLTDLQLQIKNLQQQQDDTNLLLLLHKTKGTAACLDFSELSNLAKAAETQLRQQKTADRELAALVQHMQLLQQRAHL